MKEILITDPRNRGTLEHDEELIIFMGLCSTDQEIVLQDGYKLYIEGELAISDIAEKLFNK